jgi:pimeloyl-ACP methyl ester carboxylesterase
MKIVIKNRKEQNVVVVVEMSDDAKGLAFIMHGLGSNEDQPTIRAFADAYKEKGFTVVRFDTTNTFGESDGNYEDATVTNYYEDLEDVIAWSKKQSWYREPFYLVGHSLGGISVILYAEKHPREVKGLAPIATVVSGALSLETHEKEYHQEWEKTGWVEKKSSTHPERVQRLKWSHMVDRMHYDVLPEITKVIMPVLMIVGDKDDRTPLKHQRVLFDKLPGDKELHILKDAPHSFRQPTHLDEIKQLFSAWIDKVESGKTSIHQYY